MKRTSIFFTITISFIISIILVIVSFTVLMTHNYKIQEKELIQRYSPMVKKIMFKHRKKGLNYKFLQNLEDLNYKIFLEKGSISAVTYNPKTKVLVEKTIKRKNSVFRILNLNDYNYIYLKKDNKTLLIKDKIKASENANIYIILVFLIVIITIILMYIITLRKLMPLRILKDKVKTLGDENFDFECCNTDGKDEVSLLAVEFKNSAQKLKDVKESRNVFIRNIMHELKTPITKGKFLTELERNEENNEKLKKVFLRLESLINEFASIEELISSTKNIEKKHYYFTDIIDNAKDILMLDEENVESKYENKKIEVNFKLFSIAIKNLIDNAIKYSPQNKVVIKSKNEDFIFENKGLKLEFELEKYFEPFFVKENNKDSFGLGLYIVHHILKANNYSLEYKFENDTNIFICKKD